MLTASKSVFKFPDENIRLSLQMIGFDWVITSRICTFLYEVSPNTRVQYKMSTASDFSDFSYC